MKNIRIVLGKQDYSFQIAESWDELSEDIYPSMARLFLRGPEHMNDYDKLVRAFSLFGLSAWKVVQKLQEEQLYDLVQLVVPLFTELNLSKQLIPTFYHEEIRYFGPLAELENMRFGEFCMAESFFMNYNESKDSKWLDKLIAVLYRPAGTGAEYDPSSSVYRGDLREKFNGNLIDGRSVLFRKLDLAVKDGIYLFYVTARSLLFISYQNVFKKKSSAPKLSGIDWGWLGVFDDLLGEKGRTAESLEEEFLATTLMSLERTQLKIKESGRKK